MGTGLVATVHRGYLPGRFSPQDSLGVLALLLQAPGWPGGTDLDSTNPSLAWGYWPGCFRPLVGLGVLAWLLQPRGGTGRAAQALSIAWAY